MFKATAHFAPGGNGNHIEPLFAVFSRCKYTINYCNNSAFNNNKIYLLVQKHWCVLHFGRESNVKMAKWHILFVYACMVTDNYCIYNSNGLVSPPLHIC